MATDIVISFNRFDEEVIITTSLLSSRTSFQEGVHVSKFNLLIYYQPSPRQTLQSSKIQKCGQQVNITTQRMNMVCIVTVFSNKHINHIHDTVFY